LHYASSLQAVKANDESCKADIKKLKADIKEQQEESKAAAAQEVEVAASWLYVTNPIHPTNRREPTGIVVKGKNFGYVHALSQNGRINGESGLFVSGIGVILWFLRLLRLHAHMRTSLAKPNSVCLAVPLSIYFC
jgi:hypothetical protein